MKENKWVRLPEYITGLFHQELLLRNCCSRTGQRWTTAVIWVVVARSQKHPMRVQKKPGLFELADGATILLDEIGNIYMRLEAKLLQVLQDQELQRLEGKETVRRRSILVHRFHSAEFSAGKALHEIPATLKPGSGSSFAAFEFCR